jgi:hypothetical protein
MISIFFIEKQGQRGCRRRTLAFIGLTPLFYPCNIRDPLISLGHPFSPRRDSHVSFGVAHAGQRDPTYN